MDNPSATQLPFDQTVVTLRRQIAALETPEAAPQIHRQIEIMRQQADTMEAQLFANLTPWNIVQLARHPARPQTRDYLRLVFDRYEELHGDRAGADDLAIVTALAQIDNYRVMVIGQHRGRNIEERHQSNAGCPHPEGYRKAWQKMKLAERFGIPLITFIDTKGAYPGIGAEERGQGIALAENLRDMSTLRVPVIACVIGEGGSGGALAIALGNRILMLEFAYYSVISPEGCASILWRDGDRKEDAAAVLQLTAADLKRRGFIDEIDKESLGGAHRDPPQTAQHLRATLLRHLTELTAKTADTIVTERYEKFRAFGDFLTGQTLPTDDDFPAAENDPPEMNGAADTLAADATGAAGAAEN